MKQNLNIEYSGFKANGFAMLFSILLLIGLSIWGIVFSVNTTNVLLGITCGVVILAALISLCGLMVIEPNQARVMVFFGKYRGNFLKEGFWWVNPFMSVKKISLRARNLNADPIKVNDKMGNPIMIGLVLVWKVKAEEIYKAVFNIDAPTQTTTTKTANGQVNVSVPTASETRMDALANFVAVQSDAALRQVAGEYAYDDNDQSVDELTLRGGGDEINDQLEKRLNERLAMAGMEIVEARINYLAYAPEIAAVMLRRQQASAIITAREKIVEGAVSMVKMALDKLSAEDVVELDDDKKAAMVSNLLVVLCADEPAQPVVNSGTLNH